MKRILMMSLLSLNLLFANNNYIDLEGSAIKEKVNQFKILLEKKEKEITIFSEKKEVKLPVESNLEQTTMYGHIINQNSHPEYFLLNNNSITNIVKLYESEIFNVNVTEVNNADITVNVISGKIIIEYNSKIEEIDIQSIHKVIVELNIEIIKNGKRIERNIKMDDNLEKTGVNFKEAWTVEDVENFKIESLKTKITNIIEVEIHKVIKEVK